MWLYNKSVLGMSEARGDNTRVVVIIKRVWLAVRFNCKLSFILRNELSEKIAETDSTFALSRGECVVNEALSVELPQEVLANRARKLKLVVMMISANGMVPAGFVTFPTHPRQINEQFQAILPLERCEDTRAQIKFMHLYENCGRTPLQQSFLHQLGRPGVSPSKQPPLSSHSLGKDNLRKQRSQARSPQQNVFAKPLISPRLLSRSPQQPVQVTAFDRIAEENESSLNPINQEQLVKEHQQYWLEIVRMEEEMEALKEENHRLKEENAALKKDSQALKDYYEGHEEKTHALLGEVQENGETMRRLEAELAEYRTIVAQKDELEREFQKVVQIQSSEFRQNLNKLTDQEEKLRVAASEKQAAALRVQTLEETVAFLQSEAKKHSDGNLLLREKIGEQEDRLYFLANSNDSQKNIILELESKLLHLSRENTELLTLKEAHLVLTKQTEELREQIAAKDERLAEMQRQHSQSREMLMLQSSLKEEEALFANSKHAQSTQELQELKQAHEELKQVYQTLLGTSATEQSKLKIFEREVQLAGKEKEELKMQLRRKTDEVEEVKGQGQQLEGQFKGLSLKLIQQEASLAGKNASIQQLKDSFKYSEQEKDELLGKNLAIQRQFQEMSLLLSNQVEQKNKLTILLTTLEQNYRSLQDQKSYIAKARDELLKRNADLHAQIDKLTNIAQQNQKNHQEELQKLKAELNLSQEQLGEVIEKTSVIQMQLQSTLAKLNQKPARSSSRDQYQESYNQSMTALTLKNAKLEKELQEASKQLVKDREAATVVNGQLAAKEAELIEVKAFTHNKLQENLRFMKENSELKSKLAESAENIGKLQALINSKQKQAAQLSKKNEQLSRANKESLKKIEQLSSQLQFVTEVLQRQRQDKSDIEKEIDHLEKGELPHIDQVGNLKEDSIEESRLDEGRLEIESKFVLSPEQRQKKSKQ